MDVVVPKPSLEVLGGGWMDSSWLDPELVIWMENEGGAPFERVLHNGVGTGLSSFFVSDPVVSPSRMRHPCSEGNQTHKVGWKRQ